MTCKACEARRRAGFAGLCPACANERAREKLTREQVLVAAVGRFLETSSHIFKGTARSTCDGCELCDLHKAYKEIP